VEQGKGPVQLAGPVTVLFHVIPASALTRRIMIEPWRVSDKQKNGVRVPHEATRQRYNADGFLSSAEVGDQSVAFGYAQLFRSGIAEYANSSCSGSISGSVPVVLGQAIEQEMIGCYGNAIDQLRERGQDEEIYIGFSLIGIAGMSFFSTHRRRAFESSSNVSADNVFVSPEVLVGINNTEAPPYPAALRPLVDTMWQVAGFDGTPFIHTGKWDPLGRYN
jgi:hypothetical protein